MDRRILKKISNLNVIMSKANPHSLYFWFGNDEFSATEALRAKKAELLERNPHADINDFDFSDTDSRAELERKVQNALRGRGLFSAEKLTVIRNFWTAQKKSRAKKPAENEAEDKASGFEEFLLRHLEKLETADQVYLLEKRDLDKRSRAFKQFAAAAKEGKIEKKEFALPLGFQLDAWLEERCRERGGKIGKADLGYLATLLGKGMEQKEHGEVTAAYDLYQAAGELDKLIAYADGKEITRPDIALLVSASHDMNIFNLIGCLSRREKGKALAILSGQIQAGFNENYLLTMLVYHFRNLINVKSLLHENLSAGEIARVARMNPWVAEESVRQVRALKEEDLVRIYEKLSAADAGIKTGKMEPELALDILLAAI